MMLQKTTMNDRLKFRWFSNGKMKYPGSHNIIINMCISTIKLGHPELDFDVTEEIDLEGIMLSTGCFDQNNQLIYEGDVLEELSFTGEEQFLLISRIPGGFVASSERGFGKCYSLNNYCNRTGSTASKIIGNIYELPHLLAKTGHDSFPS